MPRPSLLEELRNDWPEALGGSTGLKASGDEADRAAYSRDLWPRHHLLLRAGRTADRAGHEPGMIVWPRSTAEVQALVRWAANKRVSLVPFGAGSGVCGGVLPTPEVIVVDLKRMAAWRRLDESAPSLDVEAGALGLPLEEELGRRGYTLGHFPSSILCSTVGGWVAARSAGQCSGYYGKIEDMVVALECVTGRGDVVTLTRRSHGLDLTPLVVGSEGILAIITSVTLRLHPAPTARAFAAFTFKDTETGWEGMRRVFQAGLRPSVSRLYDPFDAMLARMGGVKARGAERARTTTKTKAPGLGATALRSVLRRPRALNALIERAGGRGLGGAMLVMIFDGQGEQASRDLERAKTLLAGVGGTYDGEEPARRWISHRYAVSYRQAPIYAGGAWVDTMEVASSWANLGALYDGVRRALAGRAFVMAHLSHAYPDGCCIYFSFAGSAAPGGDSTSAEGWSQQSLESYDDAWRRALSAAETAGGTIAHHHGVGRSKAPRLRREVGAAVDVVRALKTAFDPGGILNPGNLLPEEGPEVEQVGRRSPPHLLPESEMRLDPLSLLADVSAAVRLSEVEAWLASSGLTLGVTGANAYEASVGSWLGDGAPGARDAWLDPADHLVAGFTARFLGGHDVVVRPAPRRSVGPDLLGLVVGAKAAFAELVRVTLRVHELGAPRAAAAPFRAPRAATMSEGEEGLLVAIRDALT